MKINLVSEATYYPVKVGQKLKADASPSAKHKVQSPEGGRFEKLLLEKLSPDEATAISRLFGDLKLNPAAEPTARGLISGDETGSVPRGKFIDITI